MAIKMQIRRGLAAAWASANPTLEPGELGFVTDAGTTAFKIGDGATVWNLLAYVNSTYPELPVDASFNLNLATAQGRYPLSSANTYTSTPAIPAAEYVQGATDGNSVLTVTVPSNGIVIQQINTSVTAKQFLRAYNGITWTSWKRIDTLAAADSLSITNLTLTGKLFVPPGSAPAPSITITGDTTTGIYQSAAQEIGIATNGVNRLKIGNSGLISTTTFNAVGVNAAASGLTSAGGISVTNGSTALLATSVDGLLRVSPNTAANKLAVGGTRTATLGLTEIYINASPYLRVYPSTGAAASDLVWTGGNAAGTATTTIRCDGVPTNTTDLTHKSYVDGAVSAAGITTVLTGALVGITPPNSTPVNADIVVTNMTIGTQYLYKWSFINATTNGRSIVLRFLIASGESAICTGVSANLVTNWGSVGTAPGPTDYIKNTVGGNTLITVTSSTTAGTSDGYIKAIRLT